MAAKVLVYMKLKRAPKWWPRNGRGQIKPVGLLRGGDGWVEGDGQPMTEAQAVSAQQLAREDYRGHGPVFTVRRAS